MTAMWNFLSTVFGLLRFLANVVVGVIEGVLWLFHGTRRTVETATDAVHLARVVFGNGLTCPRGHPVPTFGTYQCSACGFTFEGSAWRCPNPECMAPVSPRTECPTCSLSVRNPCRVGSRR